MAPTIPDRWLAYKACGAVIEGTRLICFKVPLRPNVQVNKKGGTEKWDVAELLKTVPKLGGVIDLTFTKRYYEPNDLIKAGVQFKKIFMEGRKLPPAQVVNLFMDTVDEFLEKDDESLVGVHCTHGLNRSGYMVCRYMRDRLGVPAEEAIQKFEKARGHSMEREIYLKDLCSKGSISSDERSSEKLSANTNNTISEKKGMKRSLQTSENFKDNYLRRQKSNSQAYSRSQTKINDNVNSSSSIKYKKRKKSDSEHDFDYRYDY